MEPTNHPFTKETDLPNLHDYVPAVNLHGWGSTFSKMVFLDCFGFSVFFGFVKNFLTREVTMEAIHEIWKFRDDEVLISDFEV